MKNSAPLFAWKRFTLQSETLTLPNGLVTEHITLTHPGAVLIVPISENNQLVLLRQYRPAIKQWIYEFPAGTLEAGEDITACAKRELAEEAQLAAKEWHNIGEALPAPGFCNEIQYLFAAKRLSPCTADRDEDEVMDVVEFSADEIRAMIASNEIQDSKTIVAFYRAQLLGLIT